MTAFEVELNNLLNKNSKENGSDTPDFILGKYLIDCLKAFNHAVKRRTDWYGGKKDNNKVECDGCDNPSW